VLVTHVALLYLPLQGFACSQDAVRLPCPGMTPRALNALLLNRAATTSGPHAAGPLGAATVAVRGEDVAGGTCLR
jgi:hypothetical protein